MVPPHQPERSPTPRLLLGLAVTLTAVAVFSIYVVGQMAGLQRLQTRVLDRNRRDSLQLIRIQNDLNSLALAMRDMLDNQEPYGLTAWSGSLGRIRRDLEDALRAESQLAPAERQPHQKQYIETSMAELWAALDRMLALADAGETQKARELIRNTLQARQAALSNTVARFLVQNTEADETAVAQIQTIYRGVERNVYYFLAAVLLAIVLTSLFVARSNRRLFASLANLSEQRSSLARKVITVQEEILHSISRELHDEFGQILTAMGAMLRRADKKLPPDSEFREQLSEVREVAQTTLEKVRSLSQVLHPSILDDARLEDAIEWYVKTFQKQTGLPITYERAGHDPGTPERVAIHVYRVLQESLNNVARHSQSKMAMVRLKFGEADLCMEIEDRGVGMPQENGPGRRGIGQLAMRERAELVGGQVEFLRPAEGGTLVRFRVPLNVEVADE